MAAKKKTTRRKNSDRLTQAQINDLPYMQRVRVDNELSSVFLRKDKAYVTKNANGTVTVHVSKADGHSYTVIYDKKGKALNPSKRRNATIIKAKRIEHLDVSKIHNPGKSTRRKYRNGYLDLVIMGHAKKTPSGWSLGGKTFKQGKGIVPASKRGYYLDRATGTVFSKKARNVAQGFFDGNGVFHPIRSSADYDSDTAGETGRKPVRTRSKKRKTALKKAGQTARLKAETRRRKSTTSRLASRSLSKSAGILKGSGSRRQRKNPAYKKGDKVQDVFRNWHTVYDVRGNTIYTLQGDTVHVTKVIAVKKKRSVIRRQKNPRYFAYGIDANGREHDLAIRVAQNKTQTLAWVKKNYPGYKKYVVELSEKFDFIGPKGGVKIKRPRRLTSNPSNYRVLDGDLIVCKGSSASDALSRARRMYAGTGRSPNFTVQRWDANGRKWVTTKTSNPSVKTIRKEFAGTLGKASQVFAPIGTPRNVAKLGRLKFIGTESATIKPTGIVYLCADSKGKLHLCGSKNVPIYSGAAQSFGEVEKVEYETAKPHLYPGEGVIWFTHKMGENGGKRPTLYADGKGGLKFRGGSYRITREGIVD